MKLLYSAFLALSLVLFSSGCSDTDTPVVDTPVVTEAAYTPVVTDAETAADAVEAAGQSAMERYRAAKQSVKPDYYQAQMELEAQLQGQNPVRRAPTVSLDDLTDAINYYVIYTGPFDQPPGTPELLSLYARVMGYFDQLDCSQSQAERGTYDAVYLTSTSGYVGRSNSKALVTNYKRYNKLVTAYGPAIQQQAMDVTAAFADPQASKASITPVLITFKTSFDAVLAIEAAYKKMQMGLSNAYMMSQGIEEASKAYNMKRLFHTHGGCSQAWKQLQRVQPNADLDAIIEEFLAAP
jgi:hypothetical protein